MAITFGDSDTSPAGQTDNSESVSVTVVAGDVVVAHVGGRNNTTLANVTPSGVTFNGNAMALAVAATDGAQVGASLYTGVAGSSGTFACVVTWPGTNNIRFVSVSVWSGVDNSTPVAATNSASGTTSPSVAVTGTPAGTVVVDSCYSKTDDATVGAGQTQLFYNFDGGGGLDDSHLCSYEAAAGGGTVTMTWTHPGSEAFAIVAAALNPASGGGGATGRGRLVGGKLVGGNLIVRAA